jgi:hypothetical protein
MSLLTKQFLLDRQTATQASHPVDVGATAKDVTFWFTSEGTTSGGTILLEEADLASYTGTWSLLATQAASGFTGGAKLAVHIRLGSGAFVRARISSAITGGGTATVTLTGL